LVRGFLAPADADLDDRVLFTPVIKVDNGKPQSG
jgi:hypothetical protein